VAAAMLHHIILSRDFLDDRNFLKNAGVVENEDGILINDERRYDVIVYIGNERCS